LLSQPVERKKGARSSVPRLAALHKASPTFASDGEATAQIVTASFYLGVTLLIVAGAVALIASFQFHRFATSLAYPEIPHRWMVWFGPLLNVALGMISLAMAAWFIFTLSPALAA
jgi:hypothetical protein